MSVSIHAREAMPYPRLKQPNKKSAFETIQHLPDRSKQLGKRALVAAIGLGSSYIFVMSGQVEAKDDSCTDIQQQQIVAEEGFRASVRSALEVGGLIEGEQTASGIAKTLTNDRGYSISESQLRVTNDPSLFSEEKLKSGVYCVTVPGPVYSGFVRGDGQTRLSEIATANLTTVENLHKLNPALSGVSAESSLEEGQLLRVDIDVDTDYFYREMTGKEQDINTISDQKATLRNEILAKNGSILGSGGAVNAGSEAWLPATETEWMKDNDISPRDIVDAFPVSAYKYQQREASPEKNPSRSGERNGAILSGFEAGFTDQVLAAARAEVRKWPEGKTDIANGVENSNPYIKKYTGGPLGAKESWCADFLRYTLNQAGANIDTVESLNGRQFLMRRVRDVYNWMVSGDNGSYYVYKRSAVIDNRKTTYHAGDIIFLNYHGSEDKFMASNGNHVGIISGVEGDKLKIIDGNYFERDDVSQRTIDADDRQIIAIARPIEAKDSMSNINIPPQREVTPEQSKAAIDALYERGPDWENRATAMRFFMDYGLEDYQAAGLIGNFVIESGSVSLPADIEQYGGGPGRGIAQWEKGARFDELVKFAADHDSSWTDLETQLAFVVHEFETTESAAFDWLSNTPGVYEATHAVLNGYERPALRDVSPRVIEAEKILVAYRLALG